MEYFKIQNFKTFSKMLKEKKLQAEREQIEKEKQKLKEHISKIIDEYNIYNIQSLSEEKRIEIFKKMFNI